MDVWTDDELDATLGAFRSDVDVRVEQRWRVRQRISAELERPLDSGSAAPTGRHGAARPFGRGRARRSVTPWLAAAAAAGVVLAGGIIASGPVMSPVLGAVLGSSSAVPASGGPDAEPRPGQFHYVEYHRWAFTNWNDAPDRQGDLSFLQETIERLWVPADLGGTWRADIIVTGNHTWVRGSEQRLDALDATSPTFARNVRADLAPSTRTVVSPGGRDIAPPDTPRGSWQLPDAPFLSELPRDPRQLLDRLTHDVAIARGVDRPAPADLVVGASNLLMSGVAPHDLRAALFAALKLLPGVTVTERFAARDGRVGTAVGVVSPDRGRTTLIMEPETAQLIGIRTTAPDGSVNGEIEMTAVGIVDSSGARPNG